MPFVKNSECGGIAVKDINYYLELKFGFGMRINPSNYGFVGLKDFLESLERDGHISLEFRFVKLNAGQARQSINVDKE